MCTAARSGSKMRIFDKRTLVVLLLGLCPAIALAQAPPQFKAEHQMRKNVPLRFLMLVGYSYRSATIGSTRVARRAGM